ncbi:starch-binding protein [Pseudoruminococcus massiliensis]|uniref:starch-binding protein n=1 Tax=Pseudoruminococcus massiliensis TaxID=2086583 RepID=UPI003AB58B56
MKKILSVIFAAALVASMFVVGAVSTSAADDYTIYFEIPDDATLEKLELESWGSKVSVHAWNDAGNLNGEWPGAEATHVEGNIYSYTWTADSVPTGIIFNNGDNGVQTQNIDGGETVSKTDASKTVKNPAIEWGKLYKATGEGIEDGNGNTNVVVAATDYKTEEPSATESKKEEPSATESKAEPSDDKTVATGDTSAAWVLLAVVAASLGTAVVMTKKASSKD